MAELSAAQTTATDPCCAPEAQTTCCEPSAKADCCGHDEGCGCAAGGGEPIQPRDVRERYAAAVQVTSTGPARDAAR
jgi:arsenite methyltransferase